jgi:hypothetical protein
MKRLWRVLLFLLIVVTSLSAQEPVMTPETPVAQATLLRWLHGTDPRLIAWAADFARRKHDATIVAEMPQLLEHWAAPQNYGGDATEGAQRLAMLSLLDALIQENVQVPIPAIEAIAPSFPPQGAILIGRLPLSLSRSTLNDWTYGATGNWRGRTMARIASMMLAKDPLPSTVIWNENLIGFVASVVDASEDDVSISVRVSESVAPGFGSGACGDSLGHMLTPGWPQVYTYGLEEATERKVSGQVIVDLDGDQIFSERFRENEGRGSCGGVEALDPATRHRLIAHWLGVPDREMSWQPVDSFTIVWSDETAYRARLGEIVESERRKLYGTVESLRHRGLLQEGEPAMPRLEVTIRCDMTPCPLP